MKKLFLTVLLTLSLICLLATCVLAAGETANLDGKASTTADGNDTAISVTVKDNDGEKNVTVSANDVFDITVNGSTATITAIKDFTVNGIAYTKNDVVVLPIPSGVTGINTGVISNLASLREIIMDNANITFVKNTVNNCPNLEKITAVNCSLTFAKGGGEYAECGYFLSCPRLTTLDLTKASATFLNFAFASNQTIKHLILGSGNTYVFNLDSFRHSVLEEVIIPDNCNATLNQKCFAETETIKYVYIGKNAIKSKHLGDDSSNKSIFGGNSYLETIILMDIEYIGQWSLSTKKPGNPYQPLCDLAVYSHSEKLRFHNEAFNDRAGNFTVSIYTANPNMTSTTSTSNYVIYKGIGHAYEIGIITPSTCVTNGLSGYITDCPCGIDYRLNSYVSVSNTNTDLNNVTHKPYGTETTPLPLLDEHTMSDVIMDISFENGYLNNGTKTFKCLYCDAAAYTEGEATFTPIFTCLGYSCSQISNGIIVGYLIDTVALNEYVSVTGATVSYGVFAVAYNKIGTNHAVSPDGTFAKNVISYDLTTQTHTAFDIRVLNFVTDEQKSSPIVLGAYVIEARGEIKTVSYMQSDDAPSGESYSTLIFNDLING